MALIDLLMGPSGSLFPLVPSLLAAAAVPLALATMSTNETLLQLTDLTDWLISIGVSEQTVHELLEEAFDIYGLRYRNYCNEPECIYC